MTEAEPGTDIGTGVSTTEPDPAEDPAAEGAEYDEDGPRELHPLIDLPDLLTAIAPWWALALILVLLLEAFRPLVVVPALLLATVVGYLLRPDAYPFVRSDRWAAPLALLGCGVNLLLNCYWSSERFLVVRDPDVYSLTAMWLTFNPGTDIPLTSYLEGPQGFHGVDDLWMPQGNHLAPAASALIGWVGGPFDVKFGAAFSGAFALLAFYALARRLFGGVWALLVIAPLALTAPMVLISRSLYSESFWMVLVAAGGLYLVSAFHSGRLNQIALAGFAFGTGALARVDAVLALLALPLALALLSAFDLWPAGRGTRMRWAAPVFIVASLPPVLLGLLDLYWHSFAYLTNTAVQLVPLFAGIVAAWVVAVAVVPLLPRFVSPLLLRRLGIGAAGVLFVFFVVLISRPWWYVGHGKENPNLMQTQEQLGLPVDGTRTYAEIAVNWLAWYLGWPAVLIGLAGLCVCLAAGTRVGRGLPLLLVGSAGPATLLYLAQPTITPDQPWALRRFIALTLPALLLLTVAFLRTLWNSPGRLRTSTRVGVVAVAVATLVTAAGSTWPVAAQGEHVSPRVPPFVSAKVTRYDGAQRGLERICRYLGDRPVIFVDNSSLTSSMRIVCRKNIVHIDKVPPEKLLATAEALAKRTDRPVSDVVVATQSSDLVTWTQLPDGVNEMIEAEDWRPTLLGPPDGGLTIEQGIFLARVDGDGRLTQLPPVP